jgi:hypothetical protein
MFRSLAKRAVEMLAITQVLVVEFLISSFVPFERNLALWVGNAALHSFTEHFALSAVTFGFILS